MSYDVLPRNWWCIADTGTAHTFPWGVFVSRCGLVVSPVDALWYGEPPEGARACGTCQRLASRNQTEMSGSEGRT